VVSHAGLALLRQLPDRTGPDVRLSAALPSPLGGHDRGRVLSGLACAIADGARVISDFRGRVHQLPVGVDNSEHRDQTRPTPESSRLAGGVFPAFISATRPHCGHNIGAADSAKFERERGVKCR